MPGGGVALLRSIAGLDSISCETEGETTGVRIVRRALEEPTRQIADNAGHEGAVVVENVVSDGEGAYGFNARSEEYGDLVAMGIIDPTKVVRTALSNAASIATLLLTTDALVAEEKEEEEEAGGPGHAHPH